MKKENFGAMGRRNAEGGKAKKIIGDYTLTDSILGEG